MRVLGAIRQSKTRDRSISPKAQRDAIEAWAAAHGHEVVAFTEDLSTSGGLSPFERPQLGQWLTDPAKIGAFDVLVTAKLDRVCRSTADYLSLREWCRQLGKSYVSLAESLDDTTAAGWAMSTVVAAFAEFERERASERRKDTIAALRAQGRWEGGRVNYGYRAEKRDSGYYVVPDEGATADVLRGMVDKAIAGESYGAIARDLVARGIPTQNGKPWWPEMVRFVLRHSATAELLDDDKAGELAAALNARRQGTGQWTSGRHMLLRVLYCLQCKGPMYGRTPKAQNPRYECPSCHFTITKAFIEPEIEAELRARWGEKPHMVIRTIAGDDHSKEIRRLERQLEVARELEYVDSSELEAKIAELKAAPHDPTRVEFVPSGMTIAAFWETLNGPEERGKFLRDHGVKVWVARPSKRDRKSKHGPKPGILMEPTWLAAISGWEAREGA
jgi:DNA invertase Pin-like site-specific DNA recombinase